MKLKNIFVFGNSCKETVCNLPHQMKAFHSLGKDGISINHAVVFGEEISLLLLDILNLLLIGISSLKSFLLPCTRCNLKGEKQKCLK